MEETAWVESQVEGRWRRGVCLARWSGRDTVTGGNGIKCWWSVGVWKGAKRGQSGEEGGGA